MTMTDKGVANGRNCADEIVLSILAINRLNGYPREKISVESGDSENFILRIS